MGEPDQLNAEILLSALHDSEITGRDPREKTPPVGQTVCSRRVVRVL
jgi:hypothetical protein